MHILATFATLCCQTRWPRNHSCTTQEHVSFFSDIFGTFSEISTFSSFSSFLSKSENSVKIRQNCFLHVRAHSRKHFTNSHKCKNISRMFAIFCKCDKHKSDKCANVQKCVVHKMRKSAAQIIFQMQKCTNLQMHNFVKCNFLFV